MARAAALATLLAVLCAVGNTIPASMKKDLSRATAATANKTEELAAALQLDLRRNNEDYRDAPAPLHLRNPYLNADQGNSLGSARRTFLARPASARTVAFSNRTTGGSAGATNTVPRTVPTKTLQSNNKMPQLHKLLKQEGLLQKFLSGLPDAGKKRPVDWGDDGEWSGEQGGERGLARGGERGVARARLFTLSSHEFMRPTPDTLPEDKLDMLPATGERISTLKRRGRLCHRHMLFPEGPKYDSRGKVYLPAHALAVDFARTRAPRLLLPRCCNCCKKSVLGCE